VNGQRVIRFSFPVDAVFFAADRKGKVNLSAGRQILPEIRMIQKQSAVDRKDEENISL
jgi:hypothetical protein